MARDILMRAAVTVDVSILVLVDVAQWRERFVRLALSSASGFNPCSRGCCSVAADLRDRLGTFIEFQSLFSWMLLSGSPIPGGGIVPRVFQSLFSWMLLSGPGQA